MAIRKDANTLTSAERLELVNAILQLKAEGIYDQFVRQHANAIMTSIHRCPAFLPWHRRFLWDFEKELQRVSGNPGLGVPYWNWTEGDENASMWNDDLLGGNGDASGVVRTGSFRSGQWSVINSSGVVTGALRRSFGRAVGGRALATEAQLQEMLSTTIYDTRPWNSRSNPSFRNYLEGGFGGPFHNFGHMWVGGSMMPMTSPNDPVFFFHHCMVDKMWHEWQLRFPRQSYLPVNGGPYGQNLNDVMNSTSRGVLRVGGRPIDVLDSDALGIEYDNYLAGTPAKEIIVPTALKVNSTSMNTSIAKAGEVDSYRFDVDKFGEYTIETSGSSDTVITLYGPNDMGDQIDENDDGGTDRNSKIILNLSAGTYFVLVRLYSSQDTGGYSIQVNSVSVAENIPELIVDAPATSAAISARNESDIYRFRVVRRAHHTIETMGTTDTYLSLFGPNDQSLLLGEDDDSGVRTNSRIRRLLTAGEYYARVRHYSPNATGVYSISVKKQ